jgi:hypothetical protein
MSGLEETFSEDIETDDEVLLDEPQEEAQDEPEVASPDIEKASKDGWMPLEDWEGKGNSSDDWVSAKKFNERGDMIGSIKTLRDQQRKMERDFEERLSASNKLHKFQQEATIKDLEAKRDAAISDGDRDRVLDAQDQINNLSSVSVPEAAPVAPASQDQEALDDFNKDNPWIFGDSPKADYAKAQFGRFSRSMSVPDAVKAIGLDLAEKFPDVNPNRDRAPATQRNASKPGKKSERTMSWSELTREEEKMFSVGDWSKEDFLKVVSDSRKGV